MPARSVDTAGPAETEALGASLARELRDGDLVLVRGELGAGKTTLVRGAARALGVTDPVTSPTFAIGHRYRADSVTVAHRVAVQEMDPTHPGDEPGAPPPRPGRGSRDGSDGIRIGVD